VVVALTLLAAPEHLRLLDIAPDGEKECLEDVAGGHLDGVVNYLVGNVL
jgi:hypothetical protein